MQQVALSWSSGKDSAWALHVLRQSPQYQVAALFTTFNSNADRVAMHAVRRSLVEAQAERTGLPLWTVELPWPCANGIYESLTRAIWQRAAASGISAVAFGDLFLEDIRAYRQQQLAGTGLEPLFPLWLRPTAELAQEMIAGRLQAKLTCVDPKVLAPSFAARDFNSQLLLDLPPSVDPCGENGEFHTFVTDAPVFSSPLHVQRGDIVERDGFVFADLF